MLQIDEIVMHEIFVAWIVSMKTISTDDEFLPYIMSEILIKSKDGLKDIIIDWRGISVSNLAIMIQAYSLSQIIKTHIMVKL